MAEDKESTRVDLDWLIDPGRVEVVQENDHVVIANEITAHEIERIAKPYGEAMVRRLKDVAMAFNLALYLARIDTPWRQLLEEFRDDLEVSTKLQPLILPDGSQQMVLIDGGKFAGNPEIRESLWKLHEVLEEIENYQAKDHLNDFIPKEFGRQGGAPAIHDNEAIKTAIRDIDRNHKKTKKLKGSEIFSSLQEMFHASGKPVPQRSKLYELLREVRNEPD